MGIAGLTRCLEPHATRYRHEDLSGYQAIIDGPSLAYHAHRLALLEIDHQPRIPSYADINRLAFAWLNALEALNIKVSAILFDGALPLAKTDERISRLNQNNQRVKLLRSYYAATACPVPSPLGSVSYSFLAPALRESLNHGRFAQVTWVVAGEADESCASCAYAHPCSIIFSSDSDMLLYEYPTETRIMFFNDIELMSEPEFKGYSPAQMAQSMSRSSLVPFAYCLVLDKHQTFNALVEQAKKVDVESKDYIDFSRRYERPGTSEPYPILREIPAIFDRLSSIPQHLDVRISELVHRLQNGDSSPVVYLPLLVEDPNSASAWNFGQDLRILAYSVLVHGNLLESDLTQGLHGSAHVLREYVRKAQIAAIQPLSLLNHPDMLAAATGFDSIMRVSLDRLQANRTPTELTWQLIASDLLLAMTPSPPKVSLLLRVVIGDFDKTWDFVHLAARYHAVLYSLRILKQCVSFCLNAQSSSSTPYAYQALESLREWFKTMPSIENLFLVPGQEKAVTANAEALRRFLPDLYAVHQLEIPNEKTSSKKMRKKQREAERKGRRKKEVNGRQSFNVFDVLNKE